MTTSDPIHGSNQLLAALPPPLLAKLLSRFETVSLDLREDLILPHEAIEFVYFPMSGICSTVAVAGDGTRVETGLVGREGFVGAPVVLQAGHAPYHVFVQMPGMALRLPASEMLAVLREIPELNVLLLRFIHIFMVQTSHTALANGRFTIEVRLARWLLMCQDRVGANDILLTHEFLSMMLAVRRSGITDALHMLEGKHLIRSTRGHILVLDRAALIEAAGKSYGVPEAEYDRLIGGTVASGVKALVA